MEIDPDALSAAGALCVRQQGHVQDMSSYLEGVLDRPEAFSGVLTLVAGSYAGAVAAGRRGLADATHAAGLMGRGMTRLRAEVLATDDEVARRLDRARPGQRYSAPPGGTPVGQPVGQPVGGAAPTPAREPLALRVLPGSAGPDVADDARSGDGWGQRSDAAADRWRARWDEDAGRSADPGRYDAERDTRRQARDVLDLARDADQALQHLRSQVEGLGGSVRATADALGDVRAQQDFVAGAGASASAGEVARDARGWWR